MDDAIIKINTTLLDSVSSLLTSNGNGGAQNKPKLASPLAWCSLCDKPLIEFEFRDHFALTCDTVGCYLFRQTQECRAKNPRQEEKRKLRCSATYESYKAQKQENYRLLRDLGIPSKEASLKATNKQTQLALNMDVK